VSERFGLDGTATKRRAVLVDVAVDVKVVVGELCSRESQQEKVGRQGKTTNLSDLALVHSEHLVFFRAAEGKSRDEVDEDEERVGNDGGV
jgi:hypothetical protein